MDQLRTLRLREHDRLERVALTLEEVELLSDRRARLRVLARPDGNFDVEAGEVVGTIVGKTIRVVIEPKIPMRCLFFLLGFTADAPSFTTVTEVDRADTMSAMALVYAEALDRALRDGPLSTYEHRRDALRQPRGRLDHLDLVVRRFGVFPPLTCEFDEFTPDNEANRCLLAAATMLLRGGGASGASGRRLAALCARLTDVTEVRGSWAPRTRPRFDRRFDRYRPALGLADVILRHGSIELRDGQTESVGMLINMNDLFEDFVVEGLREAIGDRRELWERAPRGLWLDEGHRLPLFPDLLWRRSSTVNRLVIDAKYKVTRTARNDDVYQLTAYCQALGLRRGALVYASAREETFVVRHGGPEIRIFELDPSGEPAQLRARMLDLAHHLRVFAG